MICEKCGEPLERGLLTGQLVHATGDPKCSETLKILKDPNLFHTITINELGKKIVGEIDTRQTIFLCACGAFVENSQTASYNLMSNSEAGAGKDYILHATLSIFPKDELYIKRTRISPNVLSYWHNSEKEPDWTWNRKILYLEDVSQEVMSSPVVKVFCSSGSHATILMNQTVKDLRINGKPVVFFTSASATLNKELGRRIPIINCDESIDQTEAIMKRQGEAAKTGETLEYDERITQALFNLKRVKVLIPFSDKLATSLPATNIILRTGFSRLLDYIKASCALHQYQRKKDEHGFFLAEAQDYEIARVAFKKITSNQFYVPLAHKQKKLLAILEDMRNGLNTLVPVGFTVNQIEKHVNFWEERQLRIELDKLADSNILVVGSKRDEGAKKDSKTYLLQPLHKVELPDWETLCQNTTIDATNTINALNTIDAIDEQVH